MQNLLAKNNRNHATPNMQLLFINKAHIFRKQAHSHIIEIIKAMKMWHAVIIENLYEAKERNTGQINAIKATSFLPWQLSHKLTGPIENRDCLVSSQTLGRQKNEIGESITSILRPLFWSLDWTDQPGGSQSGELLATILPGIRSLQWWDAGIWALFGDQSLGVIEGVWCLQVLWSKTEVKLYWELANS